MDGLVHVSQVTDDFINYDSKGRTLVASESNKILSEGDTVRARIVTLSLKSKTIKDNRIGLTMRQHSLGKPEWIQASKNKKKDKSKTKE